MCHGVWSWSIARHSQACTHNTYTLDLAKQNKPTESLYENVLKESTSIIVSPMSGTLNMAKNTQVTPSQSKASSGLPKTFWLENESGLFCSELHVGFKFKETKTHSLVMVGMKQITAFCHIRCLVLNDVVPVLRV